MASLEGNIFRNLVRDYLSKMICNYALHVKGQLGYVLMGQEGSVRVKKVQIRVNWIHVGSGGIKRG